MKEDTKNGKIHHSYWWEGLLFQILLFRLAYRFIVISIKIPSRLLNTLEN